MLKSTYQKAEEGPAVPREASLPEGWTEHTAPAGHKYYYNTQTKQSTYTRPAAAPIVPPVALPNHGANPFLPMFPRFDDRQQFGSNQEPRRPRSQPQDRPKHKYAIPGARPWLLVKTKLGRRFVYNPETEQSLWRFPDDVLKMVIEYDRREREGVPQPEAEEEDQEEAEEEANVGQDDESEYEEVEITDDDEADVDEGDPERKRLKTEDSEPNGPVEFGEDDFAHEFEEFDDYGEDDELTEEDCRTLFFDLLEDFKVSPYSIWEKIIEDGRMVEDSRYTALSNLKSRRAAWDDWSRAKIQELKEIQKFQEKLDPRLSYFILLQDQASTKLYWPEFKRKYRKEDAMKTSKISDKDREKWYREHIKRLALPSSQLKTDLKELLKAQPLSVLHRDTAMHSLPVSILTDIKYISLPPKTRDALVEAYISTLPTDPGHSADDDTEVKQQVARDRQRRENALAERERRVEEQKRLQQRDLRFAKGRLLAEESELDRALNVGSRGLRSQLQDDESA